MLIRLACAAVMLAIPAMSAVMSRVTLGDNVKLTSVPPADQTITLSISLTLDNVQQLEERIRAVSTPDSPDYGKYLSKDEVDSLFSPSTEAQSAVAGWLQDNGVEHVSSGGSNINFATTVGQANRLLNADFAYYDVEGVQKLRTMQYSVPDEVLGHIHLIHPTTFFGKMRSTMLQPSEIARTAATATTMTTPTNTTINCSSTVVPDCFRNAYGTEDYIPEANSGSTIGFASFLNYSARLEDLHLYQQAYGIPESNFSVELINGGLDHQDINGNIGEANLDSQLQSAITYPLPQVQFITGGSPPFVPNIDVPDQESNDNEPYLEFYEYLLNKSNAELPQVISISYVDEEQTVPPEYARRVCDYIGMLGLRGISVLESSGDSGVGSPCMSNDGRNHTEFTPMFPASCPYVTTVGGTQAWALEIGWFASSGGFSNYFGRPWYQDEAVQGYLNSGISPEAKEYYEVGAYANFSGRAFPDIAAHSAYPFFSFFISNTQSLTGGTSASAPVVSGIIALLNDARLRAGKPAMGFLNPFIYSLRSGGPFIDVENGTAIGCTGGSIRTGEAIPGSGFIPYATWNATVGWDPVTGVGMPYFKDLLKAAMSIV